MNQFIKLLIEPFGVLLFSFLFKKDISILLLKSKKSIVAQIILGCVNHYYSAGIHKNAKMGVNVVFPHDFYGVFISKAAEIGNNCVIFQQVTIGSNTIQGSAKFGSPIIGNNVYIGCGAKIIGNVHIGNNVRIGANAVIVKDVPDNTVIVLSEMRIIKKNNLNNEFISAKSNNI